MLVIAKHRAVRSVTLKEDPDPRHSFYYFTLRFLSIYPKKDVSDRAFGRFMGSLQLLFFASPTHLCLQIPIFVYLDYMYGNPASTPASAASCQPP